MLEVYTAINFGKIAQGLSGNFSKQSNESLHQQYAQYLIDHEEIQNGYSLIRDVIIFTNIRILFVDKQGATGKKTSFKTIFLSNIVNAEMETAGFGLDMAPNFYWLLILQFAIRKRKIMPKEISFVKSITYMFEGAKEFTKDMKKSHSL